MTSHKKALFSEYITGVWNVIEGIIAITAGVMARSIALVGFGLDSYTEVASGLVLIWRLRKHGFADEEEEEAEDEEGGKRGTEDDTDDEDELEEEGIE